MARESVLSRHAAPDWQCAWARGATRSQSMRRQVSIRDVGWLQSKETIYPIVEGLLMLYYCHIVTFVGVVLHVVDPSSFSAHCPTCWMLESAPVP